MTTLVFNAGNLVVSSATQLLLTRPDTVRVLAESYIALSSCLPLGEAMKIGRYDTTNSIDDDAADLRDFFGEPSRLGDQIEDVVILIRGDAGDEAVMKRLIGHRSLS
jgi:hypothetical protein